MTDELFMRRCFELAARGAGSVSPNPMVGALLVHSGRVIGEGRHKKYGEAHAEVNAFDAVHARDRHLIPESTLFCNLEPCFHHGKTPPCVDRVRLERVRRVVIANIDPNPLVAGKSVAGMLASGIDVRTHVLSDEGAWLNRAFFTWVTQKRPYVALKWAQSADGFIGRVGERTPVSGPVAQRLVHRWRSELDAVLVGARTALVDNPRLNARLAPGRDPLRIVLDAKGGLPQTHRVFDDSLPTWIMGPLRPGDWRRTQFRQMPGSWEAFLQLLYESNVASLLVEGGAQVLQQFIDAGLWDEALILENPSLVLGAGIPAPRLRERMVLKDFDRIGGDVFRRYLPNQ